MRPIVPSQYGSRLFAAGAFSFMVAFGMASSPAAAQPAAVRNAAVDRSDALVESDVTAALNASSVLKAQQITAATIEGNVTLSGNVSDAASKEMAEMLVLRVSGVHAVSNNLTVGPQADTGTQSASNDGQQLPAPQSNSQEADAQQYPVNNSQNPQQQDSQQQDMQQNSQEAAGPRDVPPAGMPANPPSPRVPYAPPATLSQRPPEGAMEGASSGPVQIPQGTLLKVRLSELLDARRAQQGTMFEATAASDVYSGGVLAIPRGAVLEGQVVDVQSPKGSVAGSALLALKLNNLMLGGRSYALDTDIWSSKGPGKGAYSANNTVTGAAVGAIIGGIAAGGSGAAIGAVAGGATGVAASAATSGPLLLLPPETVLSFHLANPVTVLPVTYQEAQRLATASQRQDRPALQSRPGYRGYPGYPNYPGYAGYPPGYPPPPVAYGYPYGYYPYSYYPRYRGYSYGAYFGR